MIQIDIQIDRCLSTPARQFAAFAAAISLIRIAALFAGHPDLGPDEGQYWFWSKTPAFGYYSKPPVIAWSIAATTAMFGDAEWAVRLSAPLYQLGAAIFLFLLTRRIAGEKPAFWAGAAWLTLPGVFLSSALIATDAPLLFFWSAALYFFFALTDGGGARRPTLLAFALGAAIGCGFLSKYAMTYFVLGGALAFVLSPARRRAFGVVPLVITITSALAFMAPNIVWNAEHDFQTVAHTAANADWRGDFGHPDRLANFLLAQLGVAGPVMLALIAGASFSGGRSGYDAQRDAMRTLLAFAIPAMAIVTLQSFISRAHGNWAAVAYPSTVVLATVWAFRARRTQFAAQISILLHLVIGAGFLAAFVSPGFAEAVRASSAFAKLRGWESQGAAIARQSRDYDAVMTDDREVMGELVYYARNGEPIVAWNSNVRIDSHFEAFNAFDPARHRRLLYVTTNADALYIQNRFVKINKIGALTARTGPGKLRTLHLFEVSGFKTP